MEMRDSCELDEARAGVLNEVYILIHDLWHFGIPNHYVGIPNHYEDERIADAFWWMKSNMSQRSVAILVDYLWGVMSSRGSQNPVLLALKNVYAEREQFPMYQNRNTFFFSSYGVHSRQYRNEISKCMFGPLKCIRELKHIPVLESALNNNALWSGGTRELLNAYAELCNAYKKYESVFAEKLGDALLNVRGGSPGKKWTPYCSSELYRVVKFWDAYGRITGKVTDLNYIDVGWIRNFSDMFSSTKHFLNVDVDKSGIFKLLKETEWRFNIDEWDMSSAKCMNGMFRYCRNIPACISGWDVHGVEEMSGMFSHASGIPSISGWDVSGATDMRYMFENAEVSSDLSGWNVSNVFDFEGMFLCAKFVVDTDFTLWDVSKCRKFSFMFSRSSGHLWIDGRSYGGHGLGGMMRNTMRMNLDVSNWDTSSALSMQDMFSYSDFAADLSGWNVNEVIDHERFDHGCEYEHKNPCFKDEVV